MSHESMPQFPSNPIDTVKEAASDVKDKAAEVANTVADTASRQRTNAAKGLHRAASTINEKADKLGSGRASDTAHKVADGIDSTATYIEEHEFADMGQDVMNVCRRHPGKAILATLAVGFLLGRALRR